MVTPPVEYKKKDFMSDQIIRWCPGCGDYSILSQFQTVLAGLGIPREQYAVISGIGCSGRFPYYLSTYGFHTIHGRATAIASGLKSVRPDLHIWVITGDGDALSIGGNHFIHLLRRNIDVKVLLFNNEIYGLTKGQYSPTSPMGKKTKSTPMGSLDHPFEPAALALGAGATAVMRSVDVFAAHLRSTLEAAHHHTGTAFVEIYQNCNIFNDGAFASITDRDVRDERVIELAHGQPLVWGKVKRRGLVADGFHLKVVELGEEGGEDQVLKHDVTDRGLAWNLATMSPLEGFPVPIGTLYQVDRERYDQGFVEQLAEAKDTLGIGDLQGLIDSGDVWTVT